jgi:hypothetical protein
MSVEMKEINGIPDYYISRYGDVYTTKYSPRYNQNCDMHILKPRLHPSGYLYAGMFIGDKKNKKRIWKRVHRLVAEHFIGEIPPKMVINHKDFDKHNNEVTNLEIVTSSQNRLHYLRNKKK